MTKAITRLVVLAILLINQAMVTFGWDELPFSEDEIYQGVSSVATVVMTIYAWWKNNSVTLEAQQADRWKSSMKAEKKKQKKEDKNRGKGKEVE